MNVQLALMPVSSLYTLFMFISATLSHAARINLVGRFCHLVLADCIKRCFKHFILLLIMKGQTKKLT